jgi:hypothetical protein
MRAFTRSTSFTKAFGLAADRRAETCSHRDSVAGNSVAANLVVTDVGDSSLDADYRLASIEQPANSIED